MLEITNMPYRDQLAYQCERLKEMEQEQREIQAECEAAWEEFTRLSDLRFDHHSAMCDVRKMIDDLQEKVQ